MENPFTNQPLRRFARRSEAGNQRAETVQTIRTIRRGRDSAIEKRRGAESELTEIANTIAAFQEAVERDPTGGAGILDWVLLGHLQQKEEDLKKRVEDIRLFEEMLGQRVKDKLSKFYADQLEQWDNLSFDKQDVIEQFSEEHLASLSLEEYVFLLRRFPSEMVTHVTRQGIRDHVGHGQHTAGVGEMHHGFEEILKTGMLRSVIGSWLEQGMEDQCIKQMLHLDEEPSVEELQDMIDLFFDPKWQDNFGRGSGSYADRTALHVATEQVADAYYGSESGNELFFAFPSLHIASQHYFRGQLSRARGEERNDQYIWTDELKGLNINAGIVCIPEQTLVDRQTGSRYALNEQGEPEVDTELVSRLALALDDEDVQKTMRAYFRKAEDSAKVKAEYAEALGSVGITDTDPLYAICMDACLSVYFQNRMAEKALRSLGLYYKSAIDRISAKEYWESYFASHPGTRPSKIVYYNGDPTKALQAWKVEHGLKHAKIVDPHMGFPERVLVPGEGVSMTHVELFQERVLEVANAYLQEMENRSAHIK